jgi:sporulation protein YlmC with PRC-barrel domain
MRSSDLQGKRVVTETGKRLGRIREIHLRGDEVTALTVGGGGFLQRFTSSRRGHRVEWTDVRRVTDREIVVADR